jgi:N-acetylmuramoyl-L-alanine amidase
VNRRRQLIIGVVCAAAILGNAASAQEQPVATPARQAALGFPAATDFRLGGDGKHTRLIIDLTRKIDVRAFTLADPFRVVVDLPQVTFQLPAGAGERGRGLVKAFRFGLVMPGGSRIVLDTSGPARIEKAFVLEATDSLPARLVVDLAAVDRETFMRAAAIDNRLPRVSEPSHKGDREVVANSDPRPLIVLDPGHGGIDTGTRSVNGELEKNLVLDFALMLREKLEHSGKYRVVMTRSDDTFIPLGERVRVARNRKAQLFISIHCDAIAKGDGDAQGATVYTLSENASDAEAARLAESENRADVIAGVDLSAEPGEIADILIDLAQRETRNFSHQFARTVVAELKTAARMHKHPLKSAGFRVLKAPDVASVLLELGYVSNRGDLKQLTSEAWRQRVGDALVQAVGGYFSSRLSAGAAAGAN